MADSEKKQSIVVDTIIDANRGYPELKKRNPELYAEITKRQQDVARKVHRTVPDSIRHLRFR